MSVSFENTSKIQLKIHQIPDNDFSYFFDRNKSFRELKIELEKNNLIKKGEFHFEIDFHVINDDMLLKDCKSIYYSCINVVRNDYLRINIKVEYNLVKFQTVQFYILMSDFKIIEAKENKEVNVC